MNEAGQEARIYLFTIAPVLDVQPEQRDRSELSAIRP